MAKIYQFPLPKNVYMLPKTEAQTITFMDLISQNRFRCIHRLTEQMLSDPSRTQYVVGRIREITHEAANDINAAAEAVGCDYVAHQQFEQLVVA